MKEIEEQLKQIPAFRNSCGFLSNFAPYNENEYFNYEGIKYKSNEHFYQAMKLNKEDRLTIANYPFSGLKRKVKSMPHRTDINWDDVKERIMKIGLIYKFSLPRFKDKLLSTLNYEIVERNTWGDQYWGVYNDKGLNKLGIMLMEIRDDINVQLEIQF